MTRYVEVFDSLNPVYPNGENIAKELELKISKIEDENNVKLLSACFLGEFEIDEEEGLLKFFTEHKKVHKYMLFFS